MTVYFKENDWNNLKDKLHKIQQLINAVVLPNNSGVVGENFAQIYSLINSPEDLKDYDLEETLSQIVFLIEESLELMEQQEIDEAMEEIIYENKRKKSKTPDGAYIV